MALDATNTPIPAHLSNRFSLRASPRCSSADSISRRPAGRDGPLRPSPLANPCRSFVDLSPRANGDESRVAR